METNFFWSIDNQTPRELIEEYQEALADKQDSRLAHWIKLIDAKVPISPRAYVSSSFMELVPQRVPESFSQQLNQVVSRFERLLHLEFTGADNPLLVSVQGDYCGAIRNIGVSVGTLKGLVHHYGPGTAYSLYVDFLESFSTLVMGCPHLDFRKTFDLKANREGGPGELAGFTEALFLKRVKEYQSLVSQKVQRKFPERPERQLLASLMQIAWMGKSLENEEIFLTSQVHASAYGNSVQGVVYTRNPFTGEKDVYGVYRQGPEGEKGPLDGTGGKVPSLRNKNSVVFGQIKMHLAAIEASYRDVVEAGFVTDEDSNLHFVGFEKAQTTARATAVSAIELCRKGDITEVQAALRIQPSEVESLLHATLDEHSRATLEGLGAPAVTASPGTAVGAAFFRMSDAIEFYKAGVKEKKKVRVILIAEELLISDTPGIGILSGLVTKASGIGSHAAVMARANNIPCIVGCKQIEFDSKYRSMEIEGKAVKAGTLVTVEAAEEGRLFLGEGKLQNLSHRQGLVKDISQLMASVAKQHQVPLKVYANINSAHDAETALSFGAEGVGLCRTENMFLTDEAMGEIRKIVFSNDPKVSRVSLEKLETRQFEDFKKIFEVLQGLRIQIRLMDLPLNEFSPRTNSQFEKLHDELSHLEKSELRTMIEAMAEHNPMLGLRACRFGLVRPEIYDMQLRAIYRAAYVVAEQGVAVDPGIMFPLVVTEEELRQLRARAIKIEGEIRENLKISFEKKIKFSFGTMIEVPGAALQAHRLATIGEFFAFGTNDLTQMTMGMSRDDSASFLPFYVKNGLVPVDPFKVLCGPVRELVETCVVRGRRVRRDATFGICGEQSADKATLEFSLQRGLNYVSCSPFRILPARTALVHAVLNAGGSPSSGGAENRATAPAREQRRKPRPEPTA